MTNSLSKVLGDGLSIIGEHFNKKLKNFIAAYKLGVINLTYDIDPMYSTVLNKCIDSGIETVDVDGYDGVITFGNGYEYTFWNANRFYAWLHRGVFYHEVDDEILKFNTSQPDMITMYRLLKTLRDMGYSLPPIELI